ncbi:hypothetical protein FVW20_02925, partial [Desulfovibrio oxamicus]|nr:hypothetical protein [Nitratidesulfovibrio oxamicus]
MDITGVDIIVRVGGLEVLRSPRAEVVSRRRAVITRAEVELPDPDGSVRAALAVGQPVSLGFG